jgi:hypothetical protein
MGKGGEGGSETLGQEAGSLLGEPEGVPLRLRLEFRQIPTNGVLLTNFTSWTRGKTRAVPPDVKLWWRLVMRPVHKDNGTACATVGSGRLQIVEPLTDCLTLMTCTFERKGKTGIDGSW